MNRFDNTSRLEIIASHSITISCDRVWSVSWHPSGNIFATSGADKAIRIWKYDTNDNQWRCVQSINDAHRRSIRCVAWSPSGQKLASASFDATVGIWKIVNGELVQQTIIEGHENEVKCVAWSSDGQLLASCSRDKTIWIWAVEEGDLWQSIAVLPHHTQDVKFIAFHPTQPLLASGSYDNTIRLFGPSPAGQQSALEGDEWDCVHSLAGPSAHESTVWALAFEPRDGGRLLSASDDRSLKIWSCIATDSSGVPGAGGPASIKSNWTCAATLSGHHSRPIYACDWCRHSSLFCSAGGDNRICIYSEAPGTATPGCADECSYALRAVRDAAHSEDVNFVRFNPRGPLHHCAALRAPDNSTRREGNGEENWEPMAELASVSDDGCVKLWTVLASPP